MKISYLILSLGLLIMACQTAQQQQKAAMEKAGQALKSVVNVQNAKALVSSCEAYTLAFPDDKKSVSEYIAGMALVLDTLLGNLRNTILDEASGKINQEAAADFIQLSEAFATLAAESDKAPEWLFQAGDVAGSLRDYDKTLALYQRINEQYPNYERAPQVLFMRAFTLDNELKQLEQARALYQAFLEKYPDNEFADDAQFLLDNLGKSEEEIIQSFLKKQQQ